MSKREPRSPYQRYRKKPHRYSPAFEAWNTAVGMGLGVDEISRLAEAHNNYCARLHGRMPERQGYRLPNAGDL